MAEPVKKDRSIFTYGDYLNWPSDEKWEIIEGDAYDMSPSPFEEHQRISSALHIEIGIYLKGKICRIYHAPFDVILPEEGDTEDNATNIVQPDIFVVCDRKKIQRKGCVGAPDLVIEILSSSTASKDMKKKRELYERFHVKEYWIVDPVYETILVYSLQKEQEYGKPEVYIKKDKLKVGIFDDLIIDLSIVFAE